MAVKILRMSLFLRMAMKKVTVVTELPVAFGCASKMSFISLIWSSEMSIWSYGLSFGSSCRRRSFSASSKVLNSSSWVGTSAVAS